MTTFHVPFLASLWSFLWSRSSRGRRSQFRLRFAGIRPYLTPNSWEIITQRETQGQISQLYFVNVSVSRLLLANYRPNNRPTPLLKYKYKYSLWKEQRTVICFVSISAKFVFAPSWVEMGPLTKLNYAHSSVPSAYFSSNKCPIKTHAKVQMLNLSLIETKQITGRV